MPIFYRSIQAGNILPLLRKESNQISTSLSILPSSFTESCEMEQKKLTPFLIFHLMELDLLQLVVLLISCWLCGIGRMRRLCWDTRHFLRIFIKLPSLLIMKDMLTPVALDTLGMIVISAPLYLSWISSEGIVFSLPIFFCFTIFLLFFARFWTMANTFTGLKLQGMIGKFGAKEISDIEGTILSLHVHENHCFSFCQHKQGLQHI